MSKNTRAVWAYARKNKVPYDVVRASLIMVKEDPRLDVYGIMRSPTDEQALKLAVS